MNLLRYVPTIELSTTFQIVYTVPAGTIFTVSMLHISNNTGSTRRVDICVVPNGGLPSQSNSVRWDAPIDSKGFLTILRGDIWGVGVSLRAKASVANAITLRLAGIESI